MYIDKIRYISRQTEICVCGVCAASSQVSSNSSARPVTYGFQQPQPAAYVPLVQQLRPPVIPLSSLCSNTPSPSPVIPGVVAYPNPALIAPVSQLPAYTQLPPPSLPWPNIGGSSQQTVVPQNACVRIVPGVNVPKVDYSGSVMLSAAKLNWPASDKKTKVISTYVLRSFCENDCWSFAVK